MRLNIEQTFVWCQESPEAEKVQIASKSIYDLFEKKAPDVLRAYVEKLESPRVAQNTCPLTFSPEDFEEYDHLGEPGDFILTESKKFNGYMSYGNVRLQTEQIQLDDKRKCLHLVGVFTADVHQWKVRNWDDEGTAEKLHGSAKITLSTPIDRKGLEFDLRIDPECYNRLRGRKRSVKNYKITGNPDNDFHKFFKALQPSQLKLEAVATALTAGEHLLASELLDSKISPKLLETIKNLNSSFEIRSLATALLQTNPSKSARRMKKF